MEVGKIGYSTCRMIYDKLGTENGRTTLRILKLFGEQGISPRLSRVNKNSVELQFYSHPDNTGNRALITQVYDFAKRVLNQYTASGYPYINGKPHSGEHLNTISFSDVGIDKKA